MEKMVVSASNGRPVNVRKGDSIEALVIAKLPVGTVVDAFGDYNGWREIQHEGIDGWMMSKYLKPVK